MTFKRDKIEAVLRHLRAIKLDPAEFVESRAYGAFYKALYAAVAVGTTTIDRLAK